MKPKITVLVCTYNRADYLGMTLESLEQQTIPSDDFEVVVINDGSTDATSDVVGSFSSRLSLRYFYHDNQGLAASKNRGIQEAAAPLLLFQDDDDVASTQLLDEHLKAHKAYPLENYAVLGYTGLDDYVASSPLMDYVTNIGGFLYSYTSLGDGDLLDYTYFWGGRSSCKTAFLRKYGLFNPEFRFGCEDIELGYRLSKHGLKVVFQQKAKTEMVRRMTLDQFFNRLVMQGRSQYRFSILHSAREIQYLSEVKGADEIWNDIHGVYTALLDSARNLDSIVNTRKNDGLDVDDYTMQLLYRAYYNSFIACKLKGICEE